jgi:hypothetical protein
LSKIENQRRSKGNPAKAEMPSCTYWEDAVQLGFGVKKTGQPGLNIPDGPHLFICSSFCPAIKP